MFAIGRLTLLGKSISTRISTVIPKFKYCQPSFIKPKGKTSFNIKSQVAQDVVLFSTENRRFFILLNLFSACQCFFWTWMGYFLFRVIRDPTFEIKKPGFWSKILEQERKHSNILIALSLFFGISIFVGTVVYSIRNVRKIILHKGGKDVTIYTYSLPGFNEFKVPLNNISATQHRTKAKRFIPLRIKNKFFYYLIDLNGDFGNPALFDFTAGINRKV